MDYRKRLSKYLFSLYDLFSGGELNYYYRLAKVWNESESDMHINLLEELLNKWDFKPNIVENLPMNKVDLKRWITNVDRSRVYSWAYTGGSYGEPLRIPISRSRALIRTATFRYFNERAGYNLGESFALVRAKNRSSILKFLRNETIIIPLDVSPFNIERICGVLADRNVKLLMGYPTVIYEIALFLGLNPGIRDTIHVENVITVSEMLDEEKRAIIRKMFGCNLVDRYSNEEVGLIAQQEQFKGQYYTNNFGIYVEVVDPETFTPVDEGQIGIVLVTDLFNDLIPIVRYDTGDFAVAGKYSNGRLNSITEIIGREVERIFDIYGKPVSSLSLGPAIYKPLAEEEQLFQYQFVQVSERDYDLRLKTGGKSLAKSTIVRIVKGLKERLGNDAIIGVREVKDIPPQPSGKRPIYRNEMRERENGV